MRPLTAATDVWEHDGLRTLGVYFRLSHGATVFILEKIQWYGSFDAVENLPAWSTKETCRLYYIRGLLAPNRNCNSARTLALSLLRRIPLISTDISLGTTTLKHIKAIAVDGKSLRSQTQILETDTPTKTANIEARNYHLESTSNISNQCTSR
jgi:hypothetical protein